MLRTRKKRINGNTYQRRTTITRQLQLKTALEGFEVSCLRPIVSGELQSWVDHLKEEWCKANRQIEHPHEATSPAAVRRNRQARSGAVVTGRSASGGRHGDRYRERARVDQSIARLAEHLPKLEPDEEKAKVRASTFVDDAMAFLSHVRKQMVAVQTWYVEAFNRDGD